MLTPQAQRHTYKYSDCQGTEDMEFDCRWFGLIELVENVIKIKVSVSRDLISCGLTSDNILEETDDHSFRAQKYYTDSWRKRLKEELMLRLDPESVELSSYKKMENVIPE